MHFYYMKMYNKIELELINIHIGSRLRLERLQRKLSQLDVGLLSGTDNTIVGRIERAMHYSSWSNILLISQSLDLNYNDLFNLKSEKEIISIVEECYNLESRLTQDKENYYVSLKGRIKLLFTGLV